jgi:pyrroline-5-carboxylate reductase
MQTPQALPPLTAIGGGNMATAIITGLLQAFPNTPISVVDPAPDSRQRHHAAGHATYELAAPAALAPVILLAVKPQVLDTVLNEWQDLLTEEHLVVSILAGATTSRIESLTKARVIRCMPNTPMTIGEGMTGIAAGSRASQADVELASTILGASGEIATVSEAELDAVTAVSGSGPAYAFYVAECLVAAAESLGLSTDLSRQLVAQTLSGSINYLRSQEGFPAAQLRQQVTSPGGTTAAALSILQAADLPDLFQQALTAARDRSKELA